MKKTIKNWIIRSIGWALVIMVVSLSLIQLPATLNAIPNSDKLIHLSTYFLLTYWFLHAYPKQLMLTVVGFILMGVALELLQSMTDYRFFEWLDIAMNVSGVIIAHILFNHSQCKIKWLNTSKHHVESKPIS